MYWQWVSQQGKQRLHNHDAAGMVIAHGYVYAMIADAAKSDDHPESLAHYWIKNNIQQFQGLTAPPTHQQIVESMRGTHHQLRHHHPHAIASYCALLLHMQSKQAWVIYCGDCRLGIKSKGVITWVSNVHTAANWCGEIFLNHHLSSLQRHILTRRLMAKRFEEPEIQSIDWPYTADHDAVICLCTDGYWADHIEAGHEIKQLADDASCLMLAEKMITHSQTSVEDTTNFYLAYPLTGDKLN